TGRLIFLDGKLPGWAITMGSLGGDIKGGGGIQAHSRHTGRWGLTGLLDGGCCFLCDADTFFMAALIEKAKLRHAACDQVFFLPAHGDIERLDGLRSKRRGANGAVLDCGKVERRPKEQPWHDLRSERRNDVVV